MLSRPVYILLPILLLLSAAVGAQDDGIAAEPSPRPLQVWLPALLISDESGEAFQLLNDHSAAFSDTYGIPVEFRIKDVGKVGGILSTIRTGSEVAPTALPDITLIRRRDFSPSQARQYLQSMEALFSSSLINDLDDALDFGQIPLEDDVALYGLPYLLDLLLAVQNGPLGANGYRLRFEDVFANDANFLFPAARTNGLNQTFYLQYLAAGGQMPNDSTMEIDEEALRTVLEFYEELLERGLTSPDVLTYQTPAAYLTDFINRTDRPQLAIFTASEYLAMIGQQVPNMRAANIPTADGAGLSFRSGWLWVLITPEQDRQTLAARFLEQMMEPAFHASFASALNYLPMQPAILDASLPASVDSRFFADLIARAILPLPETEGGSAPRLMQEALIQVLHGDATAEAATRQALSQHAER